MRQEFTVASPDGLPEVCIAIAEHLRSYPVCTFSGGMGAGKTTLIGELCRLLGSKDVISSPTFSIVNEYLYPQGTIYHFDLYRLNSTSELLDIGFEEYLDSGQICLIEWPEKAGSLISGEPRMMVTIRIEDEERIITIETLNL